jgi:hypothetical protein
MPLLSHTRFRSIPGDVHTVIIADSQGRTWKNPLPRGWQIFSYPGAVLQQVTELLGRAQFPPHIINIVIAIGINNHRNCRRTSEQFLRNLFEATRPITQRVFFSAVPINPHLPAPEHITHMNNVASQLFTANFIPLSPRFRFVPRNNFRPRDIHYHPSSAQSIISSISTFLSSLN